MPLQPISVPIGDYAPDLANYNPQFSDAHLNVVPRGDGSWGPLNNFRTVGTGLGAAPAGAIYVRKSNGESALYAGTLAGLFRYNNSTLSWDDVTRASGAYTMSDGDFWSFAPFLDKNGLRLIACNGIDANQYIDIDTGTQFADLPNSPKAYFCAPVNRYLMLAKLATNPFKVAWSGINDSEWWTVYKRGSDEQEFDSGGEIRGIIPQEMGVVVFQEDKIRRGNLVGGNFIFTFQVVQEDLGCLSPLSIVKVRNDFFWYSQNGFCQGLAGTNIGAERVNRFVQGEADSSQRKIMRAAADPARQMIWWLLYNGSTYSMIGYSWTTGKWTRSDVNVAYIFPAVTPGATIDTLTNYSSTIDGLPYPVDSVFYQSTNILTLAGFEADGGFGYFEDLPRAARIETHDLGLQKGRYSVVQSARLVGDADPSALTAKVGKRQYHGDGLTWTGARSASSNGRVWFVPATTRAMTHRIRYDIAAGADWANLNETLVYAKGAGAY